MTKQLYIVDAANILFRSFFAIRGMQNKSGFATNALFGFIRSIEKIFKDFHPEHLVIVFDGPDNKASRTALYSEYKSHRERMPDELFQQLDKAIEFCSLYGLTVLQIPGHEADDTIGSIVHYCKNHEIDTFLLSTDKDLCQLVDEHCQMINISKGNLIIDIDKVKEIYGVAPSQIVDLLAIMGDSSDNIPGIKGIGPKTAAKLLTEFKSLKDLLENLDQVSNDNQRNKIAQAKENALLSYQLATLNKELEVPRDLEAYCIKDKQLEGLKAFYTEMDFASLLRNLESTPASSPSQPAPMPHTSKKHVIRSYKEFASLLKRLEQANTICFDTEATSLNKIDARLVGIGFCIDTSEAFYIPYDEDLQNTPIIQDLQRLFSNANCAFIGHNLKYDLHVLANHNIHVANAGFDTMVASYLLHPEQNRHGLDHLTESLFGVKKTSFKELTQDKQGQKTLDKLPIEAVADYCLDDVIYTLKLKEYFSPLIQEANLEETFYHIEMPLLPILFNMERHGIFINPEILLNMSHLLTEKLTRLEETIYHHANERFNIKSPKQLSHILFDVLQIPPFQKKKATGYSTSIDVLEQLKIAHPIIPAVIEFRALEKLRSTYVDALPSQIHPQTHRIHCNFSQTTTATGRLACTEPNLQNIPIRSEIGRKIRTAFIPEHNDAYFLSADYSQIELRIVAHLSDDPKLIEAFQHSADVHTATAALIFGVPEKEVTKEMRYQAKAVNFGIIYGQQAFGLSRELGIDIRQAAEFIKTYFNRYPGVEQFLIRAKTEAKKDLATFTLTKRRRPLPELAAKNAFLRSQAERYAVNTPIQGTQADLIKMAMIQIDRLIKKSHLKSFLILQIHDELIFEVPKNELDTLQNLVKITMETIYPLKVPLKVDISIGKNWGEC